jgi:SET domain-containing protein
MKFFREPDEYQALREKDETLPEIPSQAKKSPMPIALGDEEQDAQITYSKKEGTRLFTVSRESMPRWFIDRRVEVRMTPKMGKGCFALDRIEKNTLIESAPVILVHRDTFKNLNDYNGGTHKLSEYPFSWGVDGMCAISLGYGGIYNHSVNPNVVWRPNHEYESLQYTTSRDIEAGEEIFVRYLPLDKLDHLWFEDPASEAEALKWKKENRTNLGDIRTWDVYRKGIP